MWRQAPHPNELWHHGIKGQHWGVKHGPPYPLNEKTSASIKKKGIKAAQDKYVERRDKIRSGKLKAKGKDNIGSNYMSDDVDRDVVNVMVDYTDPQPKGHDVNVFSDYRGHYRTQGYALAIKKAKESGDDSAYKINGKYQVNNPDGTITDKALQKINMGKYGETGYSNNCTKCSAALAMQQMGYNCSAGGSMHGASYDAYEYWFNGAERHKTKAIDVDSELASQGPGAYGVIALSRGRRSDVGNLVRTGGHEVFYKVDNNGQVKYYDGQVGKVNSSWTHVNERCAGNMNFEAISYRLDKSTPNLSAMDDDGVITTPGRINNAMISKSSKHVYSRW